MPLYTHNADDSRTVREVGDVHSVIKTLTLRSTPVQAILPSGVAKDVRVRALEDNLRTFNAANHFAQDDDAPAAVDTLRTEAENFTQILMDTARTTDTQNAVAQYGMRNEFGYQRPKKLVEHMLDIEGFLLSDQAAQDPTTTNLHEGLMAGLGALIVSHVGWPFTQDEYDATLVECLEDGGLPYVAFMDTTRKRAVNAWTTTPTRFTNAIQRLEREILVYHSDLGPDMQMRWHHLMPRQITAFEPIFFGLQPNLWRVDWLKKTWWKPLADAGSGPRGTWKSEVTLRPLAEKGNFQFRGTDPSPSPSASPSGSRGL